MSPKKRSIPEWSAVQVASQMRQHESVQKATVTSPGRVLIERKNLSSLLVATTAVEHVSRSVLEGLLVEPIPDFIVNIPKESYVDGEAFEMLNYEGVPIGHEYELYKVLKDDDVSNYRNKHIGWIEQALSQDKNIEILERLHDRVFLIRRKGLDEIKIAFLWVYELTADKLRTAKRWFGDFDIVVISNPCGAATGDADAVAKSLGCRILKWWQMFEEFRPFTERSLLPLVDAKRVKEFAESKLIEKASLLEPFVKGLHWYIFGSMVTEKDVPEDIDLLIVYPDGEDSEAVRQLLTEFLVSAPIDLNLMSQVEEQELNFVKLQGCMRIYPKQG